MIKFRLFGFGKSGETTSSGLGEPAAQQPQSLPENTQTSFIGKRVLIVDDDPVFLKATTAKLQSVGLQVQDGFHGRPARHLSRHVHNALKLAVINLRNY